jgi:hypothetical protein
MGKGFSDLNIRHSEGVCGFVRIWVGLVELEELWRIEQVLVQYATARI